MTPPQADPQPVDADDDFPLPPDPLEVVRAEMAADGDTPEDPVGGWLCRLCDFEACGRDRGLCPAAGAASDVLSRAAHEPEGGGQR